MPNLKTASRTLRKSPTNAEKKLWYVINREQLGVKFRRQYPVCGYIADFICVPRKLIIEVDGGQHDENKEADAARTAALEAAGYHVLRYWNNDVLLNIEGVVLEIRRHLETHA
jgi:very-short-patch-repair endonuclease